MKIQARCESVIGANKRHSRFCVRQRITAQLFIARSLPHPLRHYKESVLSELQERIDKLEFELVHQQRITEQLNETVTEQTKELLHLGRVVDRLARQFSDLRKSPGTTEPEPTLEDEKPPHY